jgi:hypothetical protein
MLRWMPTDLWAFQTLSHPSGIRGTTVQYLGQMLTLLMMTLNKVMSKIVHTNASIAMHQ